MVCQHRWSESPRVPTLTAWAEAEHSCKFSRVEHLVKHESVGRRSTAGLSQSSDTNTSPRVDVHTLKKCTIYFHNTLKSHRYFLWNSCLIEMNPFGFFFSERSHCFHCCSWSSLVGSNQLVKAAVKSQTEREYWSKTHEVVRHSKWVLICSAGSINHLKVIIVNVSMSKVCYSIS